MGLADEAFSIASWKKHYASAFRAFSEHECEAIRELLQSDYDSNSEGQEKLKTCREKLRREAVKKYVKAPEELKALFR